MNTAAIPHPAPAVPPRPGALLQVAEVFCRTGGILMHPNRADWRKPAMALSPGVAQWPYEKDRNEPAQLAAASLQALVGDSVSPSASLPSPFPASDRLAGDPFPDEAAESDFEVGEIARIQVPARPGANDDALIALIDRIGHQDDKALAEFYDLTSSRVFGLVSRIVSDSGLAEEVVEDTFWQVWRQSERFDMARGRPLTWLLAMGRSRAIDALRRRERRAHATLDDEEQAALCDENGKSPPDLMAELDGKNLLHRALQALEAQPRQLIALAFFRGMTHEEIAEVTSLPLGTVKSQIRRSLLVLKQQMIDAGCPEWPL